MGGRQRGIALVLVLWVIALLTVIASAMVVTGRTESALIRNRVDEVRLRASAEAAAAYAVLHLTATEEDDQWLPDGTPYDWTFEGRPLRIRISDVGSLVDLNRVSDQLLGDLLQVAGLDPAQRDTLVARIKDWRDRDEITEPGGAEDAEYRSAGLAYGSKDGPFDSVEELRQVLGVSDGLYRLLAPNLTVRSRKPRPNPDFAPPLVRAALGVETGQVPGSEGGGTAVRARHGPLYRIQVGPRDGRGPSLLLLIDASVRRGNPYTLVWRRLGWSVSDFGDGEEAVSAGGG